MREKKQSGLRLGTHKESESEKEMMVTREKVY